MKLPPQDDQAGNVFIQYKKVNAIFDTSPIDGTTAKQRTIYVNEARRDNYLAILTHPPSPLGRPIFFSEEDAYVVHFPYINALVMTIHISCCRVSKILVDGGRSVNILYSHALDWMEDTPELARKMILLQTQSLYGFDGSKAHSPGIVTSRSERIYTTLSQSSASLMSNLPTTLSSGDHEFI